MALGYGKEEMDEIRAAHMPVTRRTEVALAVVFQNNGVGARLEADDSLTTVTVSGGLFGEKLPSAYAAIIGIGMFWIDKLAVRCRDVEHGFDVPAFSLSIGLRMLSGDSYQARRSTGSCDVNPFFIHRSF